MKQKYLQYYDKPSPTAFFRFSLDAVFSRQKFRSQSVINRMNDYKTIYNDPALFELHRSVNMILLESMENWSSHDYGEGYLYQGFRRLNFSGLRDTDTRINEMRLSALLKGRNVLEIGCNTGFLCLAASKYARFIYALDINPYLIDIGNRCREFLGINNVKLLNCAFEDLKHSQKFDTVLSFANHSTYDKNTRFKLKEYFQQCYDYLIDGGEFLFESHAPGYERKTLIDTIKIIEELFEIRERYVIDAGTFLDKGRTFIRAIKSK